MLPKKSLGQNFLRSEKALLDISEAGELTKHDIVLEAGPGEGALTAKLLKKAGKTIAVEKDDRLIRPLTQKFSAEIASGALVIIHDDILELTPEKLGLTSGEFKIVANIPYYITGQFLRLFLSGPLQPKTMVLLLQKEVVDRIMTRDGKESILSISIKAYGTPFFINIVKAGAFYPPPNVDSAILAIRNISKTFFDGMNEDFFFETLKMGFAHKRKVLVSNLGLSSHADIDTLCKEWEITKNTRAEELTVHQWKKIALGLAKK
jgi:16S rRNA (adenine1518-N6/adenine1519-N6)-dimethyltransferase